MKKQLVHSFLKYDDYIYLRTNEIVISELIRNLINSYINEKNVKQPKDLLLKKKETLQNKVSEYNEEIGLLNMKLLSLKEEEEKFQNQEQDQKEKISKAMIQSGAFADMVMKND